MKTVLVIFFARFLTIINGAPENPCNGITGGMECTKDNRGYVQYKCDNTTNILKTHSYTTCPDDKPECICYEEEGATQTCECIDPAARPFNNKAVDKPCDGVYERMECTSDRKGYIGYVCNALTNILKQHTNQTCPDDKSESICYDNLELDGTPQMCECIDPRTPPQLPQTGVVRWRGIFKYDDDTSLRRVSVPGELHKHEDGRFMLKRTVVVEIPKGRTPLKTRVEFDIIVPHFSVDGRSFIKYSGIDDGSRKCTKQPVNETGELKWETLWTRHPRKYYHLIKETPKQETTRSHVYSQVWLQKEIGYEGDVREEWKVMLEYDRQTGVGVPLRYKYTYNNEWDWTYKKVEHAYSYETVSEAGFSFFELSDYCGNV